MGMMGWMMGLVAMWMMFFGGSMFGTGTRGMF